MAKLDTYRQKRDFSQSPEPAGADAGEGGDAGTGGIFVIHKHAARRLHYDLRLEHGGVLWSWAVTRGPSLDPDEKRLAVHVEDHPLDYAGFEGVIPKGYGAGSVIVWDEGTWTPEADPAHGMEKGHIAFRLDGRKLGGGWHLVRLKPRPGESRDNWLLTKVKDEFSRNDGDVLEAEPASVKSGLLIEEVAEGNSGGKIAEKAAIKSAAAAKGATAARAKKSSPAAASRALQPLPGFLPPCLATLQAAPPAGEGWLHEVKFDGYRLQARIDGGTVSLLTRTGLDWTRRFGSAIAGAMAALPCRTALIDGEAVVLGDGGAASFSALQEALADNRGDAVVFYAFDLMHLDGADLTPLPLAERKQALERLLDEAPDDGPLRLSEHFDAPGRTMLRHSCRMGLEGVISKRADRPYRSGRGKDWLKSKCVQRQEFVIGGYLPTRGSGRSLGSLVMGYHEGGALVHAGRVGTGFSAKAAQHLKARLDALTRSTSPFSGRATDERGVAWVEPELVAEVEFRAWTASRTLRHATFIGLREDKPAADVVAELPGEDAGAAFGAEAERPGKAAARDAPASLKPKASAKPATSVKLSNLDKVLWPDNGFTKRNLLDYYAAVWPLMQGFVTERPLSLVRAPDGIDAHHFFQKHASPGMHGAINTMKDKDGEELIFIRDFDGLAALVQLGVLEIHLWGSKTGAVETPDQVIFDLDPDEGLPVERVREAALTARDRLGDLGLDSWLKTSGGKGFHVVMPIKPKADWARVKGFARDFAHAIQEMEPGRYTATLSKAARKGRIFIDYLRNGRGATAIAPYSTRARKGAPVSMPVMWELLEAGLEPAQFTAPAILTGGLTQTMRDGHDAAAAEGERSL